MKDIQTAFSAGELSPALFARVDTEVYRKGLATCRNFIVLAQGGAANRPGTRYVGPGKSDDTPGKLVPFRFSATETCVLEFTDLCVRVIQEGGFVVEEGLEIEGISQANPAFVTLHDHPFTEGQHVFIESVEGMEELNGGFYRVKAPEWSGFFLEGLDSGEFPLYTGAGTASAVYELATPYTAEELGALSYAQSADVIYLAHPNHPPFKLSRHGYTDWELTEVSFSPEPPTVVEVTITPTPTGTKTYEYGVSLVAGSFTGTVESLMATAKITNGPSALEVGLKSNLVEWSLTEPPADVLGFKIYRAEKGVFHLLAETGPEERSITDDGTVNDLKAPSPFPVEATGQFGGEGLYPGAVGFHEQRLWWGGSLSEPQRVWSSRTGDFENMAARTPLQADDPITAQLATGQLNRVLHLVSLKNLLILTTGAEFQMGGGANGITPTELGVKTEGYRGASTVKPLTIGETVLYVQDKGERVRDFAYRYESDSWTGSDLTLLARHLFEGRELVSWDYAQSPFGTVWAVMDDGALLSLTYLREYGVTAWSRHDTENGWFESVAVVSEGQEDAVYFTLRRELGGKTVRTVERLSSRFFADLADGSFVDAGVTRRGPPTTTVTGLNHLEGIKVSILADGNVHPPRTVSGGKVTLDYPASTVHAGLPLTADLKTLPLTLGMEGVGRRKRVSKVTLIVEQSRGLLAGPSFTELTELKQRTDEVWGAPLKPITGFVELTVGGAWSSDGAVALRQAAPLPLTVQMIVPEVTIGG